MASEEPGEGEEDALMASEEPEEGEEDALTASLLSLCDLAVEDVVERFSITREIGEGMFSKVYAATAREGGAPLALKELKLAALEGEEDGVGEDRRDLCEGMRGREKARGGVSRREEA